MDTPRAPGEAALRRFARSGPGRSPQDLTFLQEGRDLICYVTGCWLSLIRSTSFWPPGRRGLSLCVWGRWGMSLRSHPPLWETRKQNPLSPRPGPLTEGYVTSPGAEALTPGVASTVSEAGTEDQRSLWDLGQTVSAIRKGCSVCFPSPREEPRSSLPNSLSSSSPPPAFFLSWLSLSHSAGS